jgi:PAS domain S-box-containing protein
MCAFELQSKAIACPFTEKFGRNRGKLIMLVAPLPANEEDRVAALHALKILDTEPEERFDRITRMAKRLLDVPIVLISLVDSDRQWFKSRQGLDASETSRDLSFCAHAILDHRPLVVTNALEDKRFEDNGLVTDAPNIRFYAGYPMTAPGGEAVGTLCVIDRRARTLSDEDIDLLKDLASMAEVELSSRFLALQQQSYTIGLEEAIAARTGELQRTNLDLESQIRERRQVEHLLNSVFDTVDEGILAFDRTGSIALANKQAKEMWSPIASELVQCNISTLIPDLKREPLAANQVSATDPVLDLHLNKRFEANGLRDDGSGFPLEISVTETNKGESSLFTVAVRNITDRQKLDQLRDTFVANVSHELRTPLASIMGYAETLQSERPGPLTDPQRRFLEIIQRSSNRLLKLIEEILLVSQIEQGNLNVILAPTAPSEIIGHVVSMTEPMALSTNVKICVEETWPATDTLNGDEGRLEQVISNLISNAIKFSRPGGRVVVRSALDQKSWRLSVSDEGIGIPDDEIAAVFQRFFRASNLSESAVPGTGLGLYICRAIIDAHGGEMGIESTVGVGSTVWFSVPI